MAKPTYKPGDTRKPKKGKGLLRLSSSGKWFKTSNSPAATKERAKNARLDAPIANLPGTNYQSQTTERQLAHEANAATTTQYGAKDSALKTALSQAVQHQTNVGGYYDDYRKNLIDLQGKAESYNQGAMAAMQALPGMVTGLAGQAQGQVGQQQAQRSPEMGAIGAGTTATNASNAAAASQGVAGSLAAQAQLVGNANLNYGNNLLNNVLPAQKIQGLNQAQQGITGAQQDITTQKGVEGAYNENYRNTRRQDETKNLLAGATLNLNTDKAGAAAKVATKNANTASKKADASIAAENKRHQVALKNADTSAARLAETQRHNQAMEKLSAAKGTKADKKGKGPNWVTPEQQNKAGATAARMKGFAHQLQVGHPPSQKDKDGKPVYPPGVKPGVKYTRTQAASVLRQNPDMDEALLSAVLDAAYVGHLSAYTVRKLIGANYKPSQIASALGVKTRQGMKKNANTDAANAAANKVKF